MAQPDLPQLFPRAHHLLRYRFDLAAGYGAIHQMALERCDDPRPAEADGLLLRGYDRIRALSPETAVRLRQAAQGWMPAGADVEQGGFRDPGLLIAALQELFSGPADAAIRNSFRTDYVPLFCLLSAVGPVPAREAGGISFRWHLDGGPTRHLKILTYLDPAGSHDGGTALLGRAQSAPLVALGYGLGRAEERMADLKPLAERFGLVLAPDTLAPDLGEAVIFEPATVLHRGVAPLSGRRHLMTVGVIPSPVGWQDFLHHRLAAVMANTGAGFAEPAAKLFAVG